MGDLGETRAIALDQPAGQAALSALGALARELPPQSLALRGQLSAAAQGDRRAYLRAGVESGLGAASQALGSHASLEQLLRDASATMRAFEQTDRQPLQAGTLLADPQLISATQPTARTNLRNALDAALLPEPLSERRPPPALMQGLLDLGREARGAELSTAEQVAGFLRGFFGEHGLWGDITGLWNMLLVLLSSGRPAMVSLDGLIVPGLVETAADALLFVDGFRQIIEPFVVLSQPELLLSEEGQQRYQTALLQAELVVQLLWQQSAVRQAWQAGQQGEAAGIVAYTLLSLVVPAGALAKLARLPALMRALKTLANGEQLFAALQKLGRLGKLEELVDSLGQVRNLERALGAVPPQALEQHGAAALRVSDALGPDATRFFEELPRSGFDDARLLEIADAPDPLLEWWRLRQPDPATLSPRQLAAGRSYAAGEGLSGQRLPALSKQMLIDALRQTGTTNGRRVAVLLERGRVRLRAIDNRELAMQLDPHITPTTRGFYRRDEPGVINLILEDITTLEQAAGLAAHEVVHYIQHRLNKRPNTKISEIRALKMQASVDRTFRLRNRLAWETEVSYPPYRELPWE